MPFKDPEKRKEYDKARQERRKVLRKTNPEFLKKVLETESRSRKKLKNSLDRDVWAKEVHARRLRRELLRRTKGTKEYIKYCDTRRKHYERNKERINAYNQQQYYKRRPDRHIISALKRVESGDMSFNEFDKLVGDAIARTDQRLKKR